MDEDPNDDRLHPSEQPRLAAARRGDRAAFGEIYRAHAARIFSRVLLPRLGNRSAAEDALAETFRVAWERLADYEERQTSIYFWLSRIAINKAMDMHRARKVTGRALANFEGLLAPLREAPPQPATSYEAAVELERLRSGVQQTLAALNARYRRAIELRFLQDLPREECAQALEITVPTFDVVLLRSLRAFRRAWEERVGAGPPSTPRPGQA